MLDLAAHQDAIGDRLASVLSEELVPMGIAIPKFVIENISLPPEVEQALDKRTQMGIVGDLDKYTKFQTANAVEDAARNPGGGAGEGFGLGLGMAAGQRLANSMNAPTPAPAAGPPPLPGQGEWYIGVGGQQQGPFDAAGLAAQARSGALTASTLVWKTGMAQWTAAQQVPEVAAVLGTVPPPLPPQA